MTAELPRLPDLTRRDYEDQGLEIPLSDNPRCVPPDLEETAFCRQGFHHQVMPRDACWRLRKVAVDDEQGQPVYHCQCATWRPGEEFPPAGTSCLYAGKWIVFEQCARQVSRLQDQRAEERKQLVEREAKETAREMAQERLVKMRAKELVGQTLQEMQQELDY